MKPKPLCNRKIDIEREEYDALMSELPLPEVEPESAYGAPELDEKLRKIEFCMMIIVGLVLALFLFKGH
jgi:hypothetical protein